ncbi:glycosyltransferase family 1 protein [Bacillus sp. EB93]|nr:glycosyltransferase family 1 protein [Peribacillus frigoritolerans]
MTDRVLITRNFANKVNINSYNLQEIGLGKALVREGFNCDIIYYSDGETFDEIIYESEKRKLTIKWTKAVKFMSNSIFHSILNKSVLNKYDFIISTEYNQIMTFLLTLICPGRVYLYHGPYQDNNNKIVQKVYDMFLTPIIKKRIAKVFTKSDLANDYLKSKGFKNVKTIGVGLDIERLEENNDIKSYLNLRKK